MFWKKKKKVNKEDWKKEVHKQVDEKVKPLQDEVDALKTERTATVESIRGVTELFAKGVAGLAEIPGVIPEGIDIDLDKSKNTDGTELEKKIASIEKESAELKKKIEDREREEEEARKEAELQKELKRELEIELEKEENENYRSLIEKYLIKDGRINVENVEDVDYAIAEAKKDINDTLAKAKAARIIRADLSEVGRIEDSEGERAAQKETVLRRRFKEAADSGYIGSYDNWLKIIESKF